MSYSSAGCVNFLNSPPAVVRSDTPPRSRSCPCADGQPETMKMPEVTPLPHPLAPLPSTHRGGKRDIGARIGWIGSWSPLGRAQECGPRRQPWGESSDDVPEKPQEGPQSCLDDWRFSVATAWLSVLGVCRDPTAGVVGRILAPLMRLGVGRGEGLILAPMGVHPHRDRCDLHPESLRQETSRAARRAILLLRLAVRLGFLLFVEGPVASVAHALAIF
jgi:hypothetical protein